MAKKIIGRYEKIGLPELGLDLLPAKVDTGAYSCSIHCSKIEITEKDGIKVLRVIALDKSHPQFKRISYYFTQFTRKKVKSSFGETEMRFVIKMPVNLFGKTYVTEFSLSNRKNLKFPALIGRKLIQGNFYVDVSQYNLSQKQQKKQK